MSVYYNKQGDMIGTYKELMREYWNMIDECTKKRDMEVLGCLVYEMEVLQEHKDAKGKLSVSFDGGNEFIIKEVK